MAIQISECRPSEAATATAKLQDVDKQLRALTKGNGRVEKARKYVQDKIKKIKLASLEALDT